MLEILQFIFSSFWVWFGTLLLLSVIVAPFYELGRCLSRRNKPEKKNAD
jgi:hypothetical protein